MYCNVCKDEITKDCYKLEDEKIFYCNDCVMRIINEISNNYDEILADVIEEKLFDLWISRDKVWQLQEEEQNVYE